MAQPPPPRRPLPAPKSAAKRAPGRRRTVGRREPTASRRRLFLILAIATVLVLVAAVTVAVVIANQRPATSAAPGVGTAIIAPDESKAATAASTAAAGSPEQEAAQYLSEQPTAYWLTPEADPTGEVATRVADLATQARGQQADLAVVVYGLPGRDCGDLSAGGASDDAAYDTWTTEIGDALRSASDVGKIVVLEPDSLAQIPDCGDEDARVAELRTAIDNLAGDDTWIYVDAGHSDWLSVDDMARLIQAVGETDKIRGFATNVSNYNATTDEWTYAHDLAAKLDGMHALIDTSRNGAGSANTWCNPPDQLVGEPSSTLGDDVVDTNLWIKPPGESDGTCNGGPAAGDWWPASAIELTRDALAP